jgi:hypothetical protein
MKKYKRERLDINAELFEYEGYRQLEESGDLDEESEFEQADDYDDNYDDEDCDYDVWDVWKVKCSQCGEVLVYIKVGPDDYGWAISDYKIICPFCNNLNKKGENK